MVLGGTPLAGVPLAAPPISGAPAIRSIGGAVIIQPGVAGYQSVVIAPSSVYVSAFVSGVVLSRAKIGGGIQLQPQVLCEMARGVVLYGDGDPIYVDVAGLSLYSVLKGVKEMKLRVSGRMLVPLQMGGTIVVQPLPDGLLV